ncbi:hypothetical protein PFICI_14848 [Pestalotiopsis fici W106-1]|uniref:Uncharacterized protein n=1 Tax=Pestalotiopsis fici (strain W106-1 / CGMCC3.15140) TaxID=1229662 RepID=W3WH93_PESFW|nr:uncharacterized protein PFICI_14848 [Pestalotiopsis fici W106-1]ETS73243.1 hypothetical protein PFICI_14848 [Pestalotiopsis fici W106-1]
MSPVVRDEKSAFAHAKISSRPYISRRVSRAGQPVRSKEQRALYRAHLAKDAAAAHQYQLLPDDLPMKGVSPLHRLNMVIHRQCLLGSFNKRSIDIIASEDNVSLYLTLEDIEAAEAAQKTRTSAESYQGTPATVGSHEKGNRKAAKAKGNPGTKYVYPAPRFKGIEDVKPKDKDDKKDGDDGKGNRPNDDDKETRSNDPDEVDGDENDSDISIGDLNTMFA